MTNRDLADLTRRYYMLVDSSDFRPMLELFDNDVVYRRPGYEALVGKPALADFYFGVRVIDSGRHELLGVLVEGNSVAVQGAFSGRLKNGREVSLRFADFFRFREGRIVERNTYFDAPSV